MSELVQGARERRQIAERFDAARHYDSASSVQRLVGRQLLKRIEQELAGRKPRRILEFGCGTGAFTQLLHTLWPDTELIATDLAPAMLNRAEARCGSSVRFMLMDAVEPEVEGTFDLICGNLALQWVEPPERALSALYQKLSPGGLLAVSTLACDSFHEWRQAHHAENIEANIRRYPSRTALETVALHINQGSVFGHPAVHWHFDTVLEQTGGGLAFLQGLRAIGATAPVAGSRPLNAAMLKRVIRRFDGDGAAVSWDIGYGLIRKPARAGVFVTGTDTGVGKTFISACLVQAWDALYWKPLQTGLADEEGDTPTIRHLTTIAPASIVPPGDTFLAPLSPEAAAAAEGRCVDPSRLVLPMQEPERPLVVEGAGGLDVPVTSELLMIDLIARLGLPVVLVARSGLGTVNHTLLSLSALRRRGIAVAGVVLNGPLNPGNKAAIEAHGHVSVLAEVPMFETVNAESVATACQFMPAWAEA
ncbi:dethiobiotin synthase [Acetobacter sp.]|uniref:dethiobiotin synthase n=1 Tax=Acetobacter sp. TaxID=440 RepID=UPI0039E74262